ncbi:amidohydrolase family protein [Aminipila terrae]|uniref:Amidohydrolase family protein n=1 Tax=Aminipila terrae TaxID=2697030 RepID=A0A6P1ME30_9FIRM|nr:amidohydrolase family protein [Aminipila terrae]QHI72157.1 amidohydrolase family protein [Aminipila terrae]
MAFGLFKKNHTADTIFINGKIYTQNRDLPWAEAVACKDGKFIYVGNSQDAGQYEGPDTYVVDLSGKYVLPGLINTHNHGALRAFEGMYISLSENDEIEDVQGILSDYILNNPEEDVYFGYGFKAGLLKEMTQEQASLKLDEVCTDKPIMLLSLGEGTLWVNNCALEQAREAAQEDGVPMISVSYFMQSVSPFNYEELQNRIIELASEYCSKGFTSLFNAGAPEFMDNVCQEVLLMMHQQEMMKQRYFGSLEVAGDNINRLKAVMKRLTEKKTNTMELDDSIHCNVLKISLRREEEAEDLDIENVKKLIMEVSDQGFNVHIDVLDSKALKECMEIITVVRNAGYRKNIFIVACDKELRRDSEEFSLSEMCTDNVFFQPSTKREPAEEYAAIEEASSVEEILDSFTIDAAISLGVSDKLGTIEVGKLADFAVFEKNPFDLIKPSLFKKLQADMTVLGGQVVYDVEEDNMREWYDLMSGMQL